MHLHTNTFHFIGNFVNNSKWSLFTFKMVFGLKLEGPTASNISDPNSNEDNSSTFRIFSNVSSVYSSCKNH